MTVNAEASNGEKLIDLVGIDPTPTAFNVAVMHPGGDCRLGSKLTPRQASAMLTRTRGTIRLVVVEVGNPLFSEHVRSLVDELKHAKLPVVTVNVSTWRKQLGIPLKPKRDTDQAAREFASEYAGSPDRRNQHLVDAFCLAQYARRVYATPRAKQNTRRPEHTIKLSDPSLWRFWPQFTQEGKLPPLYIELLRQASPDEPIFGQRETLRFAGINTGAKFINKVRSLQGLALVEDTTITLFAPPAASELSVPAADTQPELDKVDEFLQQLLHWYRSWRASSPGVRESLSDASRAELALIDPGKTPKHVLEELLHLAQREAVLRFYRWLLDGSLNRFVTSTGTLSKTDHERLLEAVARIEAETNSPHLAVVLERFEDFNTIDELLAARAVASRRRRSEERERSGRQDDEERKRRRQQRHSQRRYESEIKSEAAGRLKEDAKATAKPFQDPARELAVLEEMLKPYGGAVGFIRRAKNLEDILDSVNEHRTELTARINQLEGVFLNMGLSVPPRPASRKNRGQHSRRADASGRRHRDVVEVPPSHDMTGDDDDYEEDETSDDADAEDN